jgi:hypothetical protein
MGSPRCRIGTETTWAHPAATSAPRLHGLTPLPHRHWDWAPPAATPALGPGPCDRRSTHGAGAACLCTQVRRRAPRAALGQGRARVGRRRRRRRRDLARAQEGRAGGAREYPRSTPAGAPLGPSPVRERPTQSRQRGAASRCGSRRGAMWTAEGCNGCCNRRLQRMLQQMLQRMLQKMLCNGLRERMSSPPRGCPRGVRPSARTARDADRIGSDRSGRLAAQVVDAQTLAVRRPARHGWRTRACTHTHTERRTQTHTDTRPRSLTQGPHQVVRALALPKTLATAGVSCMALVGPDEVRSKRGSPRQDLRRDWGPPRPHLRRDCLRCGPGRTAGRSSRTAGTRRTACAR